MTSSAARLHHAAHLAQHARPGRAPRRSCRSPPPCRTRSRRSPCDVASMTLRTTFGMASFWARSTALSSISCERSMPVRRTRRRVERKVQAGADADLEHRLAGLQRQLLDGRLAARREDPVEDEVVYRSVTARTHARPASSPMLRPRSPLQRLGLEAGRKARKADCRVNFTRHSGPIAKGLCEATAGTGSGGWPGPETKRTRTHP